MSDPTHAEVLAAIDKARVPHYDFCCAKGCAGYGFCEGCDDVCKCDAAWQHAHCDDLRAIAERHQAAYDMANRPVCPRCKLPDPCPDYQQVIDRLKGWGAL